MLVSAQSNLEKFSLLAINMFHCTIWSIPHSRAFHGLYAATKTFLRDIATNYIQFLHLIFKSKWKKISFYYWTRYWTSFPTNGMPVCFPARHLNWLKKELPVSATHSPSLAFLWQWLADANKRQDIRIILHFAHSSQLDLTPFPLCPGKTPIHTILVRTGSLECRFHC